MKNRHEKCNAVELTSVTFVDNIHDDKNDYFVFEFTDDIGEELNRIEDKFIKIKSGVISFNNHKIIKNETGMDILNDDQSKKVSSKTNKDLLNEHDDCAGDGSMEPHIVSVKHDYYEDAYGYQCEVVEHKNGFYKLKRINGMELGWFHYNEIDWDYNHKVTKSDKVLMDKMLMKDAIIKCLSMFVTKGEFGITNDLQGLYTSTKKYNVSIKTRENFFEQLNSLIIEGNIITEIVDYEDNPVLYKLADHIEGMQI